MAESHLPAYIHEHGPLEQPLRSVTLSNAIAALKREPAWQSGDRTARTLTKEGPLRVVLVLLKAGTRLAEHHADGPLSLYCISGHARFTGAGETIELRAGDLAMLDTAIEHAVDAVEESSLLLTIALSAAHAGGPGTTATL